MHYIVRAVSQSVRLVVVSPATTSPLRLPGLTSTHPHHTHPLVSQTSSLAPHHQLLGPPSNPLFRCTNPQLPFACAGIHCSSQTRTPGTNSSQAAGHWAAGGVGRPASSAYADVVSSPWFVYHKRPRFSPGLFWCSASWSNVHKVLFLNKRPFSLTVLSVTCLYSPPRLSHRPNDPLL